MANFSISATTLTFPDGTTQTTAAQSIPSGTKTNFFQAAAPTGWTQCTTYTCYSMRIVNGTGGGAGGTVAFSTAFGNQTPAGTISGSVGATTLSTTQMPSHCHILSYAARGNGTAGYLGGNNCYPLTTANSTSSSSPVSATGGGGSHTHSSSGLSFSGTAINLAVKYIDNIMATKT